MAKNEEKLEAQEALGKTQTAQEAPKTPNRDTFLTNLRGKYGEEKDDEELYGLAMSNYDAEHEANKQYTAEVSELEEILKANPDLAEVFSEVFTRGKDGNPAGALRKLPPELKRYITDENYGDEEYLANRKKAQEDEAKRKETEAKTNDLRTQAFAEVCEEEGIDNPEAILEELKGVFENPCETLEQCKEQVRTFLKMVEYDSAVQAAEIRGRNANISAQRKKATTKTDGMLNSPSAASVAKEEKPNRITAMADRRAAMKNI